MNVTQTQRLQSGEREMDIVATWFARIGALAVLLGAGFGFKLAIDHGLIGPTGRVLAAVAGGLAFLVLGEWAARRGWPRYAQASAAAGVGLLTLAVWAAYQLYGLIGVPGAGALLVVVTALSGILALRHDSQALAVLATVEGFLVPIVLGSAQLRPGVLLGYLVVLDLVVLALGELKGWRALHPLAMAGTWILFLDGMQVLAPDDALGGATVFFVVFAGAMLIRAALGRFSTDAADPLLIFTNAAVFTGAGLSAIGEGYPGWEGAFVGGIGLALLAAGLALPRHDPGSRAASLVHLAAGVAALTVAIPVQFEGPAAGALWAAEGAAFTWLGTRLGSARLRVAGFVLLSVSFVDLLLVEAGAGLFYDPPRPILSGDSLAILTLVGSLVVSAAALRGAGDGLARAAAGLYAIGAHVAALALLSFEARAWIADRIPQPGYEDALAFEDPFGVYQEQAYDGRFEQAVAFSYTAIWTIYAGVLLATGVALRHRATRIGAVTLFGVVIAKAALHDLWMLGTLYRTLGFIGLGAILLLCSLMYHRFRDVIVGEPAKTVTR